MNGQYNLPEKVTVEGDDQIHVDIPHRKLWEEFHRNNNEMILTNKGRWVDFSVFHSFPFAMPRMPNTDFVLWEKGDFTLKT